MQDGHSKHYSIQEYSLVSRKMCDNVDGKEKVRQKLEYTIREYEIRKYKISRYPHEADLVAEEHTLSIFSNIILLTSET